VIAAQVQTGHWLCAPYLKRVRKNRDEEIFDKCWWCSRFRISRTHILLRCMHPKLDKARKEIWDQPDEDGKIKKQPTSVEQLLGKSKWEQPLADWIMATGVGLVVVMFTSLFDSSLSLGSSLFGSWKVGLELYN
jgi:hypothetical protein